MRRCSTSSRCPRSPAHPWRWRCGTSEIRSFAIVGVALEIGIGPTIWHAVDLGLIPVVVTDACGGRDRPAMQRVLDSLRFSGDTLLTDIATITPMLAGARTPPD